MPMSRTSKVVLAVVGVIAALVIVGFLLLAVLYSSLREREPAVADNSVLVLKVGGPLPDHATDDPVARMFGAQTNSLSSLLTQLRKAKADRRVKAVLLDIDFVATGWAKADEVRDAVADL